MLRRDRPRQAPLLRLRSGRRICRYRGALAVLEQHGDRCVDLHTLGALIDQDLADDALVDGFDLHGRLVGLDFGDHVAGGHAVAFLFQPFGQIALFHRRGERRHQNIDRHGVPSP
jgi:hypothetical protein